MALYDFTLGIKMNDGKWELDLLGFLVMPIVRWISLCRNRFRAVDLFGRSDGFVSESVIAMHNSRLPLLSFGAFVLFSHVCATTAVVSSGQPGEEQHMADPTPSKVDRRFAMLGP